MAKKTNEERLSENRLFYTMFLTLGLGTLVVSTNFFDPINLPKLFAVLVPLPWMISNLTQFANLRFGLIHFQDFPRRMFSLSIFLIAVICVLSPSPIERSLIGTWGRNNGMLTALVSILLAWSAYELGKRTLEPLRFVFWAHNILLVTAAYGLIQVMGADPISWSSGNMRIFSTFGNTNFAAAAWALGAICSSILLLFGRNGFVKGNYLILLLSISFLVYCFLAYRTGSIQGLAAIASFHFFLLILKLWKLRLIFSKVISGLLILIGLMVAHSLYFSGPFTSLISSAGSLGFRKIYWSIGAKMFSENPILGIGVDSYGDYYRTVRSAEMAKATSIDLIVNNAHNSFIQTLATLGIVGAVAIIFPVILTLATGLRRVWRNEVDATSSIFLLFVTLWLLATFSIDNISITLWNWVFLGLALGLCSKRDVQQDSADGRVKSVKGTKKKQFYELRKLLTNGASILIFVFLFAQVSSPDRTIVATFKSPVSFEQPDTVNNRLEKIEDISRMRFLDPQHFMILARALVELQQVPQATSVLQRGTDWYPRDFALFDYLSNTLEQQGKWSEAAIARQRQVELDPRHARVWSYLARDLFQAGDEASARRAAQRALENFYVFPQGDQESIKKLLMELGLI